MDKNRVILECKWLSGRYSYLIVPSTGKPLAFLNGSAVVAASDLDVLKKDKHWGREFGIRGELQGGPARPLRIRVVTAKGDKTVKAAPEGARLPVAGDADGPSGPSHPAHSGDDEGSAAPGAAATPPATSEPPAAAATSGPAPSAKKKGTQAGRKKGGVPAPK